jgi:RimJ/RimL family protein N-acetyltransferase
MTDVTLTGRFVRLEPLTEAHRAGLRAAADDPRIWEFTLTDARGPGFEAWFDAALNQRADGTRFPFAVVRLADGRLVGSTSYLDPVPQHRRVEIGSTWYAPDAWGTAVNPECKLLLLAHAFDELQWNRVALVTDLLNRRSQAAIEKLGAVREGVLRAHMISQGGRLRDSVLYSIVRADWPAVRAGLAARTAAVTAPSPSSNTR